MFCAKAKQNITGKFCVHREKSWVQLLQWNFRMVFKDLKFILTSLYVLLDFCLQWFLSTKFIYKTVNVAINWWKLEKNMWKLFKKSMCNIKRKHSRDQAHNIFIMLLCRPCRGLPRLRLDKQSTLIPSNHRAYVINKITVHHHPLFIHHHHSFIVILSNCIFVVVVFQDFSLCIYLCNLPM